jgi:hypothetical protein
MFQYDLPAKLSVVCCIWHSNSVVFDGTFCLYGISIMPCELQLPFPFSRYATFIMCIYIFFPRFGHFIAFFIIPE